MKTNTVIELLKRENLFTLSALKSHISEFHTGLLFLNVFIAYFIYLPTGLFAVSFYYLFFSFPILFLSNNLLEPISSSIKKIKANSNAFSHLKNVAIGFVFFLVTFLVLNGFQPISNELIISDLFQKDCFYFILVFASFVLFNSLFVSFFLVGIFFVALLFYPYSLQEKELFNMIMSNIKQIFSFFFNHYKKEILVFSFKYSILISFIYFFNIVIGLNAMFAFIIITLYSVFFVNSLYIITKIIRFNDLKNNYISI